MMPLYEYECMNRQCGNVFTKLRPIGFQHQRVECPECTYPAKPKISAPVTLDNKGTKLRRKLDKKKPRTP